MKINNNVPPGKPAESELMHGDFSTFQTNLCTPSGGEVISSESNKSMATEAKGIQDTNTKLLIKSLNTQLEESEKPKVYYNPKEVSVD
jgi:hypothetical protein